MAFRSWWNGSNSVLKVFIRNCSSHESLITTHWNISCKMLKAWGWENLALKYFQVFKFIYVLSVYRKVRWTHMWIFDKDDIGKTGFILICIDSHCFEKTVYHLFGPGLLRTCSRPALASQVLVLGAPVTYLSTLTFSECLFVLVFFQDRVS